MQLNSITVSRWSTIGILVIATDGQSIAIGVGTSATSATACNSTHGLAKAILSVNLSVRLLNAWIVTKRNNRLSVYQHHVKERRF